MKTALITGVTGQDGAYLAQLLLEKGYRVIGLVRSLNHPLLKLKYLGIEKKIDFKEVDLLDFSNVYRILVDFSPDEIYNLAAQSSVGLSYQQSIGTIQFNILSVLNLLEAIKLAVPHSHFYEASSSEMYGKVEDLPVTEENPMHPLSPYAVSKASAHWITVNYRESYGLFACCGILFNHESYLRDDSFFIKKVIKSALKIKNGELDSLRIGNIDLKRDFGYSPDYVHAMWLMLQQKIPDDYIICSGKSISLREIVYYVFDSLKISHDKIIIDPALYRPIDIRDIYGDNSKAKTQLKWAYNRDFFDVLDLLIDEEKRNLKET